MIEIDLFTKHTKKALGMAEHATHKQTWRQRLPEILLEIGIIVFAITLSIQLHAWHERVLNRAEEREFLLGLRTDLQADLTELRQDSLTYVSKHKQFDYLIRLSERRAAPDSLHHIQNALYSIVNLQPNDSRFEGLRGSGKLGLLQDKKLLNLIMDLYQERIPSLLTSTRLYTSFLNDRLGPYLDEHATVTDTNLAKLLATDQLKRYVYRGRQTGEIVEQYHRVMANSRAIIREIDRTQQPD